MILALYNFKLRLYSEISLENSITKDWVGEQGAKRSPCTAAVLQKRRLHCHKSSVRPNLKTSPPKKMKAFWKNTAIPGYTTSFSLAT